MSFMASQTHRFPRHWDVLDFDDALDDATGGNVKIQTKDYLPAGVLPVIDQGQKEVAGYIDSPEFACRAALPCILFGDHTRLLKFVDRPFALGADGVKVLVPREGLHARFVYHYLRTVRLPKDLGYSRHFKYLREAVVPRPPLAEQQRIAELIDKAEAICRKQARVIALTEQLLRSSFLDMFGDPVNNPKGWQIQPLAELATITTGNTPSRAVVEYFGDDIEWIKSDNINTPSHFLTRASEGLSEHGRAVGRVAGAGSTLVTCIAGTPECIGNVALADRDVAFNQQINAVTPRPGVDHRFLYTLLLVGKMLVQAASTNGMKGMVSKGRLEAVRFPAPPTQLQVTFGHRFDRILAMSRREEAALSQAERLLQSVVQQSFGPQPSARAS